MLFDAVEQLKFCTTLNNNWRNQRQVKRTIATDFITLINILLHLESHVLTLMF